jgi:D-alanine-D-alanine ligase
MRMLLIAGGWSSEREVSLSGARMIEQALKALGHEVRFLDPATQFADIIPAASQVGFAFINLHGSPGEDGLIQALLEKANCPYQGAGPTASFLALNKAATKSVYARFGLATPAWRLYCGLEGEGRACDLPYPLFVKPNTGGSSLGMSLVREGAQFGPALDKVFTLGQEALVETCVSGLELTCAVLDQTPLPVIMIRTKSGSAFFDYENKYAADGAEELCPAPIDPELAGEVQRMALAAHRALGISGYSRSDFMVGGSMAGGFMADGDGPQLLETNTLPGMTPTSLLPKAAAAVGLSFEDLVSELVRLGLEAHAQRTGS